MNEAINLLIPLAILFLTFFIGTYQIHLGKGLTVALMWSIPLVFLVFVSNGSIGILPG